MTALDFRNLLTTMNGGTHRVFNVNGHRVYVRCSSEGARYLLIEKIRYDLTSPSFDSDVNAKLKE